MSDEIKEHPTNAIDSNALLEKLFAQAKEWERKARTLDEMEDKLERKDPARIRIAVKAGCFRGVARDLKILVHDYTSNV